MKSLFEIDLSTASSFIKLSAPDESSERQPYIYAGKFQISLAEWISVPSNPRQRDTEAHSVKAKKSHLRNFDPAQAMVAMAVTPDGRRYKLDGHTRCFLWESGDLPPPPAIMVDIWKCVDVEAVKRLYLRFDAATAAETGSDRLRGAAREYGLNFNTPMLRDGHYGTAIKRVFQIMHTRDESQWSAIEFLYEAVDTFKSELALLDDLSPQPIRFPSGIIAAAIITLRKDQEKAKEFWGLYEADFGTKDGRSRDGVQALADFVKQARYEQTKKKGNSTGTPLQAKITYAAFEAFERWRSGKIFGANKRLVGLSAAEAKSYIRSCR